MGFDQNLMPYIHHYNLIQSSFAALKIPSTSSVQSSPPLPSSWQPLSFLLSLCFASPRCHTKGILYYVVFSDWLLSLSNEHLRFIHVFVKLHYSYLFIVWIVFNGTDVYLQNNEGFISYFLFLAIMNKVSINISLHVFKSVR